MAGEERVTIAGSFPTPCIFLKEEVLLIGVPAETVVKILEPIRVFQISYNGHVLSGKKSPCFHIALSPAHQKTPTIVF